MSNGLAILGGSQVRTKPFASWPVFGELEEERLLGALQAFGPYLPDARKTLDYGGVRCPNCETICGEQGAWLEQSLFLGTPADMDDIARAFEKVYEHRSALEEVQL